MVNLIMALALAGVEVRPVDYFATPVQISNGYSYWSMVGNPPSSRVFYATEDLSMKVSIIDTSGRLVENPYIYQQVPRISQLYENVYLVPQDTYFQVFVSGPDYRSYQLQFESVPEPGAFGIMLLGGLWIKKIGRANFKAQLAPQ